MRQPLPVRRRTARPRRLAKALQGIANAVEGRVDVEQFDGAEAHYQPSAHRYVTEEGRQRVKADLHLACEVCQQFDIHPRLGQRAQVETGAGRHGAEPRRQVAAQAGENALAAGTVDIVAAADVLVQMAQPLLYI